MEGAWYPQEGRQLTRDVVLFGQLMLFGVGSVQEEGDSESRGEGFGYGQCGAVVPGADSVARRALWGTWGVTHRVGCPLESRGETCEKGRPE